MYYHQHIIHIQIEEYAINYHDIQQYYLYEELMGSWRLLTQCDLVPGTLDAKFNQSALYFFRDHHH